MTIREATVDDTDRLVEMAQAFIAESRYADVIVPEPARLALLIAMLLQIGTVLVADTGEQLVGMIALATITPVFGGPPYCDEVAWWVEPSRRSGLTGPRLLRRAEVWARAQGLGSIKMVAPSGTDVGAFYEKRGYEAIETTYLRRLH
jgi:GNAT superfamily N-acetyltransferase